MLRSLGLTVVIVLALGAALATPLGARELTGLSTVVNRLSEPGALLIWGTALAGLSRVIGRRP